MRWNSEVSDQPGLPCTMRWRVEAIESEVENIVEGAIWCTGQVAEVIEVEVQVTPQPNS